MMVIPVVLSTRTFSSQTACQRYFSQMLSDAVLDQEFWNVDLMALLQNHPSAASKIGVGVRRFVARRNIGRVPGFYLIRNDGSEEDFSIKVCIKGPRSHKEQVNLALRLAIEPQKRRFREKTFRGVCEVTGKSILRKELQIDHIKRFEILVDEWFSEEGVGFLNVGVREVASGEGVEMAIEDQKISWQSYHRANATLRCVSKEFNLSRKSEKIGD